MSDICSYCNVTTAGHHERHCPNAPRHYDLPHRGWICPRCLRVWAPHIDRCDCEHDWFSGFKLPAQKDMETANDEAGDPPAMTVDITPSL